LALGSWFRLDTRFEIIGAVVFLGVAAVLLMLTQRRNAGGPLYLYVPVAFFLFSIVQWQSALWNVQMPRFLILALFALALYAVCRSARWRWFAVAAVATVLASLSLLEGLLLWPVIACVLWCDGRAQRGVRLGAWAVIGLGTAVVYFVGFDFGKGNSGGTAYAVRHPLGAAHYLLVLLGGFSRATPALATAYGVLMVALSAWVVVRFWRSDRGLAEALPAALVLFVFLFDVSTLLGRGSAGAPQALASRYTTYNLLIFVAAYLALVNQRPWRLASAWRTPVVVGVSGVGLVLVAVLATASWTTARHQGHRFASTLRTSANVLRDYRTEPTERLDTYLCPAYLCDGLVPQEAPFLETHRYSVFANGQGASASSVAVVPAPKQRPG
jgi:hypothetical protein